MALTGMSVGSCIARLHQHLAKIDVFTNLKLNLRSHVVKGMGFFYATEHKIVNLGEELWVRNLE